ncbi:MAG: hypothetical protein JJ992_06895, partial [Planctomycetes bacterium]|nr:hypothetical protein [Planctomycetota bacterium]
RGSSEALDEAIIADLSSKQISRMTVGELERVVQASPLPYLRPGLVSHLVYQDRSTLERLVHLASFCCRNRHH